METIIVGISQGWIKIKAMCPIISIPSGLKSISGMAL